MLPKYNIAHFLFVLLLFVPSELQLCTKGFKVAFFSRGTSVKNVLFYTNMHLSCTFSFVHEYLLHIFIRNILFIFQVNL